MVVDFGGAKLKVNSAYRPTDPRFRNQSFPTRHVRSTDPPRAARRSKFWVGTTDRPTLFGPARAGRKPYLINSVAFRLLAGRNDRPTDPTSTDSGQSDLPTDRPNSEAPLIRRVNFQLRAALHRIWNFRRGAGFVRVKTQINDLTVRVKCKERAELKRQHRQITSPS